MALQKPDVSFAAECRIWSPTSELAMSRYRRFELAGVPQHVVQRGNNRQPCFLDDMDRERYLDDAKVSMARYDVEVHAYVLMSNHVHLLLTGAEPRSISRAVQLLGRRFVAWFNRRHARTGTLWEGRFHSSPIGSDAYFWNCQRYIELNPVRAGVCATPADFAWSSHRYNASGQGCALVTPSREYLELAHDPASRQLAYGTLFARDLSRADLDLIRSHLQQQRAWGDESFQARIAAQSGRVACIRASGRPRRLDMAQGQSREKAL